MTKKNPNYTGRPRGKHGKDNTETWVTKAENKYGDAFDYSHVEYIDSHTPVKIICLKHGEISIRPGNHLNQAPCGKCGIDSKRLSELEYKQRLEVIYGDTLDLSKTKFIGGRGTNKTLVGCKIHGFVSTSEYALLKGCGCPECSTNGYRTNKPGSLYVLICDDITKVGITNITAKRRIKEINASSKRKFSIIKEITFDDGSIPDTIETLLLEYLSMHYKNPNEKFDGYTECFYDVDREELLERVDKLCSNYSIQI